MTQIARQFFYREVGLDELDLVGPLWEKLNAHHSLISRHFGSELAGRTFGDRRLEFLAKTASGRIKIDLVTTADGGLPVAYCVSSLSSLGVGEIDSIYVDDGYRGAGIGGELMRRALAWLDEYGAVRKIVSVAYLNEPALAFYARFGFHPANIILRQKEPDGDTLPSHDTR